MEIGYNVAVKNDRPYLSEMVLRETFPNYYDIDSLTAVVREHHLPIDKNSTIYAISLKEADKKARRQEMSAWFKKHYGTDTHPDPYVTVEDDEDDNPNDQSDGKQTKTNINDSRSTSNDTTDKGERKSQDDDENSQAESKKSKRRTASAKNDKQANNDLGEQYTPIIDERQDYDRGLQALPFDLDRFEMVLLSKIAELPVTIEQSKKSAFVSRLEIKAIPYKELWLVALCAR
jgi:hypothetical protein